MVFSDLFFLYFFLPLCLLCYVLSKKLVYRNVVLIVFSLIFYAWGEPLGVFLLLLNALINYLCGLAIEKYRGAGGAKIALAVALVMNLGILGVFKYSAFFVNNLNLILPVDLPVPKIALPIGISFYTFQALSYIIDCYWGKVEVQKSYAKLLMYISLFPQLVAGPIVRYSTIAEEIDSRSVSLEDVNVGVNRLIIGLAKKVILANNLGTIVEAFFGKADISGLSVLGTWYAVVVYALQIYFDFSGYSDMAIGLGRLFGFHFNENFNYPFICRSVTEFWQRWHISLSTWFRDYVLYIPLFGRRRKYGGLFLVWFCTGLWHGANWNYIIWGLYFGVFIALELLITKKRLDHAPGALMHLYNKLVIIVGFGIFYFEDMGKLGDFFKNLIGANGNAFTDPIFASSFANNIFLVLAALIFSLPVLRIVRQLAERSRRGMLIHSTATVVCNVVLLLVCSIMLVNATNNPFLYFRW